MQGDACLKHKVVPKPVQTANQWVVYGWVVLFNTNKSALSHSVYLVDNTTTI